MGAKAQSSRNKSMNRVLLIDDDEQLGPPLAMYFKRFDLVDRKSTRLNSSHW